MHIEHIIRFIFFPSIFHRDLRQVRGINYSTPLSILWLCVAIHPCLPCRSLTKAGRTVSGVPMNPSQRDEPTPLRPDNVCFCDLGNRITKTDAQSFWVGFSHGGWGISEFRRNPISPLPQIEARPTLTFANVHGTSGRWSTIARDPCAIQSRRDRLSPAQPAPDEQSYGNRLRFADSSDVCRSAASRERP